MKNAVKKINKPFLIIHGDQDLAVPIKEAEAIFIHGQIKPQQNYLKLAEPVTHLILNILFEGTTKAFERVLEQN